MDISENKDIRIQFNEDPRNNAKIKVIGVGGGARLPGMMEVMEDVLRRPVRIGLPIPMAKLPSMLAEPEFATVIGMVFYAHRSRVLKTREERGFGARLRSLARTFGM